MGNFKQIDIFGNEINIDEIPIPQQDKKKYKTMQEQYGMFYGFKCGDCRHCIKFEYNNKTYYKCENWFISHSEATDIRLKNIACKKFINKEHI